MSISDNIKKIRKEKGLTQKDLAKGIGKSIRMVQKYEKGEVYPSIDILNNIADILEVTLNDFIDSKTEKINFNLDNFSIEVTPKINLDEKLISELIFSLVDNKELGFINLLDDDLKFITEYIKKNLIDVLNLIRQKNNYIYKSYFYHDEFKEQLENDPNFNK